MKAIAYHFSQEFENASLTMYNNGAHGMHIYVTDHHYLSSGYCVWLEIYLAMYGHIPFFRDAEKIGIRLPQMLPTVGQLDPSYRHEPYGFYNTRSTSSISESKYPS